jgi:hypothetical protein
MEIFIIIKNHQKPQKIADLDNFKGLYYKKYYSLLTLKTTKNIETLSNHYQNGLHW